MIDAGDLSGLSREELIELNKAIRKALVHKRPLTAKQEARMMASVDYAVRMVASSLHPLTTHEVDERLWKRAIAKLAPIQEDRIVETARAFVRQQRKRKVPNGG